MSRRLDKSFVVIRSIEDAEAMRCVDLFRRPDGSFGFEEFRRDFEDRGVWTPVQYFSETTYSSDAAALAAATGTIAWLAEVLRQRI